MLVVDVEKEVARGVGDEEQPGARDGLGLGGTLGQDQLGRFEADEYPGHLPGGDLFTWQAFLDLLPVLVLGQLAEDFGRVLGRSPPIEQIGGLRRFQWAEGSETGNEQIQVRTGAGLSYYVSPSRALDISLAEFGGRPLTWQSANGDIHPAYYDESGAGWLRTAVGGLLVTCGLSYVGSPGEDEGQEYGLHES